MKTKKLIIFLLLLSSMELWSQKSLSSLEGEMVLVEVDTFNWQGRVTKCPMNFYVSKYEVTQGLWKEVTGKNPSYFGNCGLDCPVERVSWYQAMVFCNELSERMGKEPCYYEDAGYTKVYGKLLNGTYDYNIQKHPEWKFKATGYRLPLEVEWEYAARGGKRSRGYTYSGSNDMNVVGWYSDNSQVSYSPNSSGRGTHSVGQKQPNELGLYDISGNVNEWIWDSYADINSTGGYDACSTNGEGSLRVIRGGYWNNSAYYCHVSFWNSYNPDSRYNFIGFRLCRPQ